MGWGDFNPPKTIPISSNPFSKEKLSVESGQKNAIKLFNELASRAYVTFMEQEMQKSVKDSNPWSIYYLLIVGAEESGKSETVDYLCAKFIEKYLYKQVDRTEIWTSVTSKFKDYLYTQIPEGKKFLFISGEDLTGMRVIDEEESKRRRHKAREKTGCDSGIIFDISCMHDILAVNKLYRDAAGIIISKSAKTRATSPHAAIHQQYFLTKNAVEFLNKTDEYRNKIKKQETEEKIAEYMLKYGHYYGYGAIWSKIGNKIVLWYNPKVNIPNNKEKAKEHNRTDYLYDLEYKREGEPEQDETISLAHFDSEGIDFSYPVFDKIDVTDLITLAIDERKFIMNHLNITSPRLKDDRKFKAFRAHYIDEVTLDNLAEQLGFKGASNFTNSATSGGWFAHIRQEYLGHAIEYLLTQPGQIYEGFTRIAGNLHIDLIKGNIGIEVKTRHRPNDSPSDDWLSTHTKKQLLESDYSCSKGCKKLKELYIFRVLTNRTTGLIAYIHRVVKKESDEV